MLRRPDDRLSSGLLNTATVTENEFYLKMLLLNTNKHVYRFICATINPWFGVITLN